MEIEMPKEKKSISHLKHKIQSLETELKQLKQLVRELKEWKNTDGEWMSEAGRWRKHLCSWKSQANFCSGFFQNEEEMKKLFVELLQTESRIPLCTDIIGIVTKYINWSTDFQKK